MGILPAHRTHLLLLAQPMSVYEEEDAAEYDIPMFRSSDDSGGCVGGVAMDENANVAECECTCSGRHRCEEERYTEAGYIQYI